MIRMKVLMLGWEFPPFSSGGLGTHCYYLTKSLKEKNTQITFIMPGGSERIEPGIKLITTGSMRIIRLNVTLKPYRPSLSREVKIIASETPKEVYDESFFSNVKRYNELACEIGLEEDFDIIHCHDWMTFDAGVRLKKETGKPLVVTIHSTEFDRTGGLSVNDYISHMEWYGMFHADKVITVSNYMKKRIVEKYSVPPEKIKVIYNAVNPEEFWPSEIKPGFDEKIVLFLGRITLQKGPDYFLEAAKLVLEKEKNVKFVVVGKGDMLPSLIEKSLQLGIINHVFFTGYQKDIKTIYSMADVYVMPSVSEPFGITALEAMSSGTPVIVSKQSGISEAVKHRLTVDFWDVKELANKILGVLRYSPVKNELSKNGLQEARRMTWDRVAEKTLNVYHSVLQYYM